jgi:soluble lytic murein transglycosylase-like protein
MCLKRLGIMCAMFFAAASGARAEYVVLRSGQRLSVTGYQLLGDTYRLQINGGIVEVPAENVVTIEPEEVFVATPAQPAVAVAPYRELVETAARRYNVDADLISSVIAVESNFEAKAVSRKNARGLMQLLPETAAKLGVQNIFDPKENIEAGTKYLSALLAQYHNDVALALAAYNAGPDKVERFGRVPPYRETVSYVRRVKSSYAKRKTEAAVPPASANVNISRIPARQ